MVEKAGTDLAAVHLGGSEDRLEVHGLPDRAGFDVLGFEREADLLTGDTGNRGIDGQAGEPAGRLTPGGFRLHGHARESLEGFGVGSEVTTTARDLAGQARELAESDAGRDIAEAVVIPDGRMFVMRSGIARLGGEEARLLGQFRVIGDEHAATTGGDNLVTVEGMDAGQAERARRGLSISGTEGFGSIFNQFHAVLIATGLDGSDIRRLTIEMHEDEGLGRFTGLGFLLDDGTRERGVHVPAAFFGIDEDGLGAEIGDGGSGSDKGQRRAQDFVARTDTCETQRKMQGRGA